MQENKFKRRTQPLSNTQFPSGGTFMKTYTHLSSPLSIDGNTYRILQEESLLLIETLDNPIMVVWRRWETSTSSMELETDLVKRRHMYILPLRIASPHNLSIALCRDKRIAFQKTQHFACNFDSRTLACI